MNNDNIIEYLKVFQNMKYEENQMFAKIGLAKDMPVEEFNNLISIKMEEQTKTQTFGEKAVGLNFNQSNLDAVSQIKKLYADVIDSLNTTRTLSESGEVKRLCSVAITEAQAACMWAVKALTWKD